MNTSTWKSPGCKQQENLEVSPGSSEKTWGFNLATSVQKHGSRELFSLMEEEEGDGTSGNISHDSVSTNSSLDLSDGKCNDETMSRLPKWNSQCKAVQNVKGLLEDNDEAQHLTFSNSHVIPVIKFLKDANEICDIKMQKDGAEVLWAILSGSRQSYYKSIIVACGVLPSILKLLVATVKEFHLLALKILANLSNSSDAGHHITYLGYVPKLVSFLEYPNARGYSIEIINNIRNIEEALVEAIEVCFVESK
ncbi:hypothetical protein F3Y22_tig00110458pilonHSYRG00174 [Hibiscus syriacus]|uniref:Uncharacterized protein n=1 Tax=Hibiscus syriacus TaxID=106335 RepID=A0A6A3AML5_HIBSY|nr:hypothetical protein F3Y22_tig00110458pilonHSYRG00174 [Hibiscus syriacus]